MFLTVKRFKQDSKVFQSLAMSSETLSNDLQSSLSSLDPGTSQSTEYQHAKRQWLKNDVQSVLYLTNEGADRCIN